MCTPTTSLAPGCYANAAAAASCCRRLAEQTAQTEVNEEIDLAGPDGSLGVASPIQGTIVAISVSVNALIAVSAGSIAALLATRPRWVLVQRWLMGTVLAGLALRMATDARR